MWTAVFNKGAIMAKKKRYYSSDSSSKISSKPSDFAGLPLGFHWGDYPKVDSINEMPYGDTVYSATEQMNTDVRNVNKRRSKDKY